MSIKERFAPETEVRHLEFVVYEPSEQKVYQKAVWWINLAVFLDNFWGNCDVIVNKPQNITRYNPKSEGEIEIIYGETGSRMEIRCSGQKVAEVDFIKSDNGANICQLVLEENYASDPKLIAYLKFKGGVRVG